MSNKILGLKKLSQKLKILKKKKKKIVLCHGVFDVLHIGHINHFNSAKKLGDILVVSVTPDKFVKKGPNRPIFPLNIRMQSLSALKNIDYITANTTETAVNPILDLKPDIYCKGKDYKDEKSDHTRNIIKEVRAIKSVNGKINYTEDRLFSSSNIINSSNLNLTNSQMKFLKEIRNDKKNKNLKISNLINSFSDLKVLVIGETMIDEYLYCDALGKSGKEPVLAVKNLHSEKFIGGTLSIAKNLSNFCKKVTVLSYVGEKKEQLKFLTNKLEKNINPIMIPKKKSCTIIKRRIIDDVNKTKILGLYSIEDHLINKKEERSIIKIISKIIGKHDLVIVSDYGHGFITDKVARLIIAKSKFLSVNAQLNSANVGYHTISKYKNADLVIINETEMRHEMRDKSEKIINLIKKLALKINPKFLTVTSGNQGSITFVKKNKKIFHCPAFAFRVFDKIGAGDTMLAYLSLTVFKKINTKIGMFISSLAAAFNVENAANSKVLKKTDIIKSAESYLK
tara:strand:+ start:1392 stop:2921 length:1530 start_codon:yes stop_codon:yes gene_type:complete